MNFSLTTLPVESQNIYDNPDFFFEYGNLPRSQHGLQAAPKSPTLEGMILSTKFSPIGPSENPLKGSLILDLGCGYGWFIRWAREKGAAYVKGVDISQNMISRAKEFETEINHQTRNRVVASTPATEVIFEIHDLETITLSHQPKNEAV